MLGDYYCVKVVECKERYELIPSFGNKENGYVREELKKPVFEDLGLHVIRNLKVNVDSYRGIDIATGDKYRVVSREKQTEPFKLVNELDAEKGFKYIDGDQPIIPVMEYLKYTGASYEEIREWKKVLHAYDRYIWLEKQVNKCEKIAFKAPLMIKELGGVK